MTYVLLDVKFPMLELEGGWARLVAVFKDRRHCRHLPTIVVSLLLVHLRPDLEG